ncbi:CMP-N-acetylneuraminate-poly-alpha-2,8-sialyltransferase-like [Diadema setosum]|uniref:CMP-N-acetylneuraminate-poly-alpha-2, 8-sialyltransferase-like n=1 Tax=Diadema setosum TaxID=31175 RepID=UPI003B3AE079
MSRLIALFIDDIASPLAIAFRNFVITNNEAARFTEASMTTRRKYHRVPMSAYKRSGPTETLTIFIILTAVVAFTILMTYLGGNAKELLAVQAKHVETSVVEKVPKPPPPAEPMAPDISGDHFTYKLWQFTESVAEKVFFYQHFLQSAWRPNATNLLHWRSELLKSTGNFSSGRNFIVTTKNFKENSSLIYYLNRKPRRGPMRHYKSTHSFFKKLPPESPLENKKFKRCSLVGNSGILLGSQCGRDIDSSEYVFRCNAAPLLKYRDHAGMKSNITTMNPSIIERKFASVKHPANVTSFMHMTSQYHGQVWLPCFGVEAHHVSCLRALDVYNQTEPELVVGHPDHYRLIWEFWKSRKLGKAALSTGFYLTQMALTVCEETHLYGFWPFPVYFDEEPGDMRQVPYHYFDDLKFSKAHDMNHEFLVLLQMHKLGLLRLHVGKCS